MELGLKGSQFQNVQPIDWERIHRAYQFYQNRGYSYVEVPWAVSPEIVAATIPPGATPFTVEPTYFVLVGSAEQGLLDLVSRTRGDFKSGQLYFALTPCFRPEQGVAKGVTQFTFMKLELFCLTEPKYSKGKDLSSVLLEDAQMFMCSEGAPVHRRPTKEGEDLYLGELELGSYGMRKWKDLQWAYGTGLAEPRFSVGLSQYTAERNSRFRTHVYR